MKGLLFICISLVIAHVNSQSPCDQVSYVNRTEWGAREPTSITNLTSKPLSFYVVHHSYEPGSCFNDKTCIERVKAIQNFHLDDRGWADIGYHFLIGENGKVYEGRGWNRQAAHSPGWNNDAYGICIIGDFQVMSPNEAAINALRSWIACGIQLGYVVQNYYVITHRQSQVMGYTVCPGDGAFNVVKGFPRFCPFQNPGANSTGNQTIISFGKQFCEKEIGSFASKAQQFIFSTVFFPLLLIYIL